MVECNKSLIPLVVHKSSHVYHCRGGICKEQFNQLSRPVLEVCSPCSKPIDVYRTKHSPGERSNHKDDTEPIWNRPMSSNQAPMARYPRWQNAILMAPDMARLWLDRTDLDARVCAIRSLRIDAAVLDVSITGFRGRVGRLGVRHVCHNVASSPVVGRSCVRYLDNNAIVSRLVSSHMGSTAMPRKPADGGRRDQEAPGGSLLSLAA